MEEKNNTVESKWMGKSHTVEHKHSGKRTIAAGINV